MRNLNKCFGARSSWRWGGVVIAIAGAVAWLSTVVSTAASPGANTVRATTGLVALPGHVHALAQPQFDIGEAPNSLQMGGLELVLARTAAQQQALEQLLAAQQDPKSPQYHHWLTPAQYGSRFGASTSTVAALSQWLEANGFEVSAPPASRARLAFHGTKAQVEAAFHILIHLFEVGGVQHFANVSDPQVPAALAPLISAIQGLNDFYPKPGVKVRRAGVEPQVTYDGGKSNYVGPGDFATIYNLLPLYKAGASGSGVTIAIAGQSDIAVANASAFWTGFGLTTPQFNSIPVPGGTDPGQTNDGNEDEAYLDVEIVGSLAQGASILLVRDTSALFAAQYVVEQNLAAVLNISFSACESSIGSTNSAISSLFQQAASQGITVTVSAADSGVAGCASDFTQGELSTSGFAVNGIASTPYDLAVGGTDFDPTQPQAWATGNATGTLTNALGHIPEMVWNDTCANPLWVQYYQFASTSAFCNTTTLNSQPNPYLQVAGGGGGFSSCLAVTNNTCAGGYGPPSWQTGVAGIQSFPTRAIPDVSMIAAHWLACSYEITPCDPTTANVSVATGTSAAAPSVAAIIAILDQEMSTPASPDGRQGLINGLLYKLATAEYGSPQSPSSGASACSASLGTTIGAGCIFYNVAAGTNAMPCQVSAFSAAGSAPASTCTAPSGDANGIMEISSTPQYAAGTGFNLATGLGSINAGNLVLAIYLPPPSGLAASSAGRSVNLTWTAEPHASSFNIYQGTQSDQEGATPVQSATGTSATVSGLQYGQTYFFTIAAQSAIGASGASDEAHATIVPAAPSTLSASAGNGSVTLTWAAATGATTYNVYQGTSSGGESAQPVSSGLSGTSTTISGLSNGTTYYFTVAGVDAGGASAMSPQTQGTPTAPAGGGGELGLIEAALLAVMLGLRWQASTRAASVAVSNRR
jgi:subtilase family serine protease